MNEPLLDLWILVVDHRAGRLLRGSLTAQGSAHFAEAGAIASVPAEKQHGRPSPKKGKDGHAYASWRHEAEELRRRHAQAVAGWLAQMVATLGIARVLVFAPAHLLGALRAAWSADLAPRIEEHAGDLNYLTLRELGHHPVLARHLLARRA